MQSGLKTIWSQATFCTTTRTQRPGRARSRKLYLNNTQYNNHANKINTGKSFIPEINDNYSIQISQIQTESNINYTKWTTKSEKTQFGSTGSVSATLLTTVL